MSPDVQTRLRDLAEAMPETPAALDAVERRARQRVRHGRAAATVGAAVVVLTILALLRLPMQPPPVIQGDQSHQLRLSLCRPPACPDPVASLEDVLAALRDDPAVVDVEVVDIETQRREAAEAHDMALEELPADMFTPVVRVAVQPGEDDLVTVARRLKEALPGVGVRRSSGAADDQVPEDMDSRAAVGPSHDLVEVDVGSVTVTARMWPVEGGGRCVGVADLASCDTDHLLTHGEAAGEAWGRPELGVTCVWSPVAAGVERMSVSFANGTQADGEIGDAPPGVLAGAGLVCVDARTHPTTIDYDQAGGGGSSSSGMAPWSEVRPPGVPGWSEVTEMVFDQFPEDRAEDLVASGDPADRGDDLAAVIADLELPEGLEELRVYDTSSGVYRPGDDRPSAQVAAAVTTTRGDPICMVALLYDANDEPRHPTLMLDRPVVWTPEDGCPPLP